MRKLRYFEYFYYDSFIVILIHSTEVNNWNENQRIMFGIIIYYSFSINVQLHTIYLLFIHIWTKNTFLTISSEQRKWRNAGHYELRNVDNSLSVNSNCMVHFMTRASEVKLKRHRDKL